MSGVAEISFVYDSDGKMVIKEEADGTRTLYIGNYLEIEIPSQGTPTPTPTATASQPRTFTATATPTTTMTPTPTATGNPTDTPTATSANTPTITQTPTVTNTPAVTHTPTPTATSSGTLIFADGFESGDFSAWDSSTTDGGDLSVTTGAAMVGTYGMSAVIDDNNAIYVTDDSPNGETEYVVRFYFDPNSISMSNNDNHTIFFAYKGTIQPAMRVELRYYSGNYQVKAQARKDSLYVNTSYYTITDDEHYIEVAWSAATSPGANNGELTLYVDGVQKESITNIDNDTIYIDRVQLGAVAEIDTGTRGTYYFDAFESRSSGYIGSVAALPGNSVAQVVPADSFLASISYWLLSLLQEVWEAVVNFFQPDKALAGEIQVESKTVMSMVMLEESIPSGQVWKTYYYAGSQRVAMRVNDGETNEVYYLFSDHLGSTSITMDSGGNRYGEMRYTAWGEVRYASGEMLTDYTYTGQRSEVSSFGLMYYNARWYDSALGRFVEADTILPGISPLSLDRYAYAFNNPLNYIDPSGHSPECGPDGVWCDTNPQNDYDYPPLSGSYIDTLMFFLRVLFHSPVRGIDDDSPGFGQARGVYLDMGYQIFHPGVDLGSVMGTDVFACAPGVVVYADYNEDMGYTVIIEHDINGVMFYSIYAHLGTKNDTRDQAIFVEKGVSVYSDTHIGEMGNTKGPIDNGEAIDPHLHFEIRTSLNVDLDLSFPLKYQQWWMNQDGGNSCSPWTICWLDLGIIYGYDPSYDLHIANGFR